MTWSKDTATATSSFDMEEAVGSTDWDGGATDWDFVGSQPTTFWDEVSSQWSKESAI